VHGVKLDQGTAQSLTPLSSSQQPPASVYCAATTDVTACAVRLTFQQLRILKVLTGQMFKRRAAIGCAGVGMAILVSVRSERRQGAVFHVV
jgi:hypothetical protein